MRPVTRAVVVAMAVMMTTEAAERATVIAKAEAAERAKAAPPVVVVETAEAAVICTAPHRS